MNKLQLSIVLMLLSSAAYGQIRGEKKRHGSYHVYANVSADYHINNKDIKSDNRANKNVFISKNTLGTRVGFDFVHITKHRVYMSVGFDFRLEPQKLEINYVARDMGFGGSNYEYHDRKSFTNQSIETKFKVGRSILLSEAGALDIAAGISVRLPLNGSIDTPATIFHDVNNSGYKDPILYQRYGWGTNVEKNTLDDIASHPNISAAFQVAYRFLQPSVFPKRSLRIGADVGITSPSGSYNNKAVVESYSANRADVHKYEFNDNHLFVGLLLGIEL